MADWNKIPADKVQTIVSGNGDAATVAWAHRGEGSLAALPDPQLAIAAAVALGNATALSSVNAPKDLKKAAAAALHRLRSTGVKVEAPKPVGHFQLSKDTSAPPSRAFISLPDIEGSVELLLTASDAEESCALGIVLGGGVEDVRHAHLGRGELRDTWRSAEGGGLQEIPFTTGLYFADKYLSPRADHNWHHFLQHVPAGTLQVAKGMDPFANLPATKEEGQNIGDSWVLPQSLWDASLMPKAMNEHFRGGGSEDDPVGQKRYDAVVADITVAMDRADRGRWVEWLEVLQSAFRLHGRVASAEKAEGYKQAILAGEPSSSLPFATNSVKLGLMREATSQMSRDQ